ncbi:MAG: helix-turn-helix domain-containing protein [Candidatus Liptonbacteria bacterium]|nr:helix-turn-helix domain-containing protein [Candidatus Liptonbacteria bacterium]
MPENINFQDFFNSKIRERGLTLKKLSELSGITLKYLEYLSAGNFEALPSAPYFRGYLEKLGRILDFDDAEWWQNIKEEEVVKTSGTLDQLPKNRFALSSPVKFIWPAIILILVVFYFGARFSKIFGQPRVSIAYPTEAFTNIASQKIVVRGELKDGDKLVINGEVVVLEDDGSWEKNILLEPGLNTILITAKKFLGREIRIIRQVLYKPGEVSPIPPSQ